MNIRENSMYGNVTAQSSISPHGVNTSYQTQFWQTITSHWTYNWQQFSLLNPIGHHIQSTQADHACQHASQRGYIDHRIGDLGARQPSPTLVTNAHKVQEISRLS